MMKQRFRLSSLTKSLQRGFIGVPSLRGRMRRSRPGGGGGGGGGGGPTLVSATIGTAGTSISLVFSASVSIGAGGNGGFVPTLSGGAASLTYVSGAGSTTLTYLLGRTVNSGETGTLTYTQPGNGVEATTGAADVSSFSGATITNNSTAGGVGGSWSNNFRATVGLNGVEDYNGILPYLNLMKSSSRQWENSISWADPRLDANGEPANQNVGEAIDRIQWLEHDTMGGFQIVKYGTYVIKWSGAGDFAPQGISSTLTGPGRRTFTITSANSSLSVVATGPCTNLRLCHIDHEALLDSGTELLNPDFVAWLQSWENPLAYRFLDFQAANFSTVTNPGDWCSLSHISWCRQNGCPPEIIAEVARKTGDKPVWTLMPYLATDACMIALFQRMKDWYNGTYSVLAEGINECWNYGFPGTAWAQNTYAYTIQVRDESGNPVTPGNSNERINSAYAHHSMRVWAAADSVFGSSRVRPMAGTQTGFPDFMGRYVNYFDTGLYGGATVKSLLNARGALVQTHYFSAGNSPAPSATGRTYKQMCIDNWGALSDDTWINAWRADIDHTAANYWAVTRSTANSRGCTAPMICYEGGNHDFIDRNDGSANSWGNFSGTVNTGDNTIALSAGDYNGFSQFDRVVSISGALGGGLDAYGTWAFCRKLSGNRLRLYPSLAAATADTGDAGTGAGVMNAGTFFLSNITRHKAIQDKISSLLQGARGLEICAYIYAAFSGPNVLGKGMALFAGPAPMRVSIISRFTYCFEGPNKGVFNVGNESHYMRYLQGLNVGDWPTLANTGVPVGTTLTASGSITTTSAGQVIQDLNISGYINVAHPNVIIRRCRITKTAGGYDYWARIGTDDASVALNTLVEDCEVDGGNFGQEYGIGVHGIVRRCQIKRTENGINPQGHATLPSLYEDNHVTLVQPASAYADPHSDTCPMQGGNSNVTVRHNTLDVTSAKGFNSHFFINSFFGNTTNILIDKNRLIGTPNNDGYNFYCYRQAAWGTLSNVYITNNRIVPAPWGVFANMEGQEGGLAIQVPPALWVGNVNDSTNAVIPYAP